MRRVLLAVLVGMAASVALAFLLLPVVAIFVHTTPGRLVAQLSNPVAKDAFVVSIETSLIACSMSRVATSWMPQAVRRRSIPSCEARRSTAFSAAATSSTTPPANDAGS